jgi:hypothetical protein
MLQSYLVLLEKLDTNAYVEKIQSLKALEASREKYVAGRSYSN